MIRLSPSCMTAQWTLITLFAASATPTTAGCAAPVPRLRSAAVRLSGRQCNGDGCSNRDVWSQGLTWRFSRIIIKVTRLLEEYSCGGYCTPAGLAVRDRLRQRESRYYSLTLVARRPGSTRQSRPRPPLPPPFWRCPEYAASDEFLHALVGSATPVAGSCTEAKQWWPGCAEGYGPVPVSGQTASAGPADHAGPNISWPVQLGPVPPLARGLSARQESAPGLEQVLLPGRAVLLAPEQAAKAPDWQAASGKTQLAVYAARSLLAVRTGPAGLGDRGEPGIGAVRVRRRPPRGWGWITAATPRRWRPGSWPGCGDAAPVAGGAG